MTDSSTKKYAFVLGRERDLCFAELKSVLVRFGFCSSEDESNFILSDNVAIFNLPVRQAGLDKSPEKLIEILGGVTKIYGIVPTESDIRAQIKGLVLAKAAGKSGKFNFGFSAYGRHRSAGLNALGLNIKKELKRKSSPHPASPRGGEGPLRFIALKDKELSTIVSSKNKLATDGLEIGFFNDATGVLIAVTDPEGWSERDYDKPRGDKFSGMVPPKLARAMVNIALGAITKNQETNIKNIQDSNASPAGGLKIENCKLKIPRVPLVVDPFCGSGNILLEALMLGCDVFGSDSSEKAVSDSRENTAWLLRSVISSGKASREIFQPGDAVLSERSESKDFSNLEAPRGRNDKLKIIQADATSADFEKLLTLNLKLSTDKLVIVSEPYLGEPKKYAPSLRAVKGEYEKIKELYLSFFKNFKNFKTLVTPVIFCLVFPLVETAEGRRYSLYAETVDEIKKIGYTELSKPQIYGRDYQVVKREIVLLQLT